VRAVTQPKQIVRKGPSAAVASKSTRSIPRHVHSLYQPAMAPPLAHSWLNRIQAIAIENTNTRIVVDLRVNQVATTVRPS
jgi:hypothetical protein